MSYENRSQEIISIINIKEKKWNSHMLRVCTKTLSELPKKEFKRLRNVSVLCRDLKLEFQIMEKILIDKANNCNDEEWGKMHKRLLEFESVRMLHPRKKYIDY